MAYRCQVNLYLVLHYFKLKPNCIKLNNVCKQILKSICMLGKCINIKKLIKFKMSFFKRMDFLRTSPVFGLPSFLKNPISNY